jgi:hypothetical protein
MLWANVLLEHIAGQSADRITIQWHFLLSQNTKLHVQACFLTSWKYSGSTFSMRYDAFSITPDTKALGTFTKYVGQSIRGTLMARPRAKEHQEVKSDFWKTRVSPLMMEMAKKACAQNNLTMSDLIRDATILHIHDIVRDNNKEAVSA